VKNLNYILYFILVLNFGVVASEGAQPSNQVVYVFDRMITVKNPLKSPPAIPKFLVPEKSKFIQSTDLRSGYYTSLEATLVYEHPFSKIQLNEYLLKSFEGSEWRLLQSEEIDGESVFLAEGYSKKTITVLVKDFNNGSRVHVFYKKNSAY